MNRSAFVFIAALAGLGATASRSLADQAVSPSPVVHNADEALQALPGAKVVHGGSISFAGGTAQVIAFDFGTEMPRDVAAGMASGKRQHDPITIVRTRDSASPLLLQALNGGGTVKLAVGADTYVLHGVNVVSSKRFAVTGPSSVDTHELEVVAFTFQEIEISNVMGGKSATDDWNAPGGPTPSPRPGATRAH